MAMKHDGHATYDEVPDLGPVEGTKYLCECAVRHVPIVSRRQLRLGAWKMAKPTKHRDKWRIRWADHAGKRQSEVYEAT